VLSGQIINHLAEAIYFVALTALVYQITGSSLGVAGALMAMTVPILVLAPISGFLIDKLPRRPLIVGSCLVRGMLCFAIPFVTEVQWIYIITFVYSVLGQFVSPIISAVLPEIVERESIFKANTWMGLSFRTMQMLGSAISGILIFQVGAAVTFWIICFLFIIFAIIMIGIPMRLIVEKGDKSPIIASFLRDMAGAVKFIFQKRIVLFSLLVFSVTSFNGASFNTLALEFTEHYLGSNEQGFGLLLSFRGAGALIGMIFLLFIAQKLTAIKTMLYSLLGVGGIFLFLGFTHVFWLVCIILFLEGLISCGFTVATRSIQQEHVPTELRGKVIGLSMAVSHGLYTFSAGLSAALAVVVGIPIVFVGVGLLLIAFVCIYPMLTYRKNATHVGL
jgi:DHA3 family macrolide efflux protein-like MFS transporter